MSYYSPQLGFGNNMNYGFQELNAVPYDGTNSFGFRGETFVTPVHGIDAPSDPGPYLTLDGDKEFNEMRNEVSRTGQLFQDRNFPPDNSSLFPSKPLDRRAIWRRPLELTANAKFIVDGVSRFDVKQGELGDCWLLAAVSNLTLHPKLFDNIVCPGQTFDHPYFGAFRFRFWWFGKWVNIVVDDLLPTVDGKLAFMHSVDGREFWSALLEKAYAKLHGSYEALAGGRPSSAMDDFTGGVSELFNLKNPPSQLFDILLKGFERGSLIACTTEPNPLITEERLSNGIIKGHAYSVTCVMMCPVRGSRQREFVPLLRVRNPWGNEAEWNGPWSDRSPEWQLVPSEEKLRLGLNFEHDGEFWISYRDFLDNFSSVEMTNIHLESLTEKGYDNHVKHLWEVKTFEGSWRRGVTAGGCQNFPETFWNNSKFYVTLRDEDDGDKDNKCTMIVALLQKPQEKELSRKPKLRNIGFALYPVPQSIRSGGSLNEGVLRTVPEIKGIESYVNMRQVSHRFYLSPGTYCVIPSTYQAGEEADFILRLFCEKPYSAKDNDVPIGFITPNSKVQNSPFQLPREIQQTPSVGESDPLMREIFERVAGVDGEIDWRELQNLLNNRFHSDFPFDGFSKSDCRSMIAMLDSDKSGKLGLQEFTHLWNIICIWKKTFQTHDKDFSGKLTEFEFRDSLLTSGFQISNKLFQTLITIYGDETRQVSFDDFVICAIRMSKAIRTFQEKDWMKSNSVSFSLEEFMEQTLCI